MLKLIEMVEQWRWAGGDENGRLVVVGVVMVVEVEQWRWWWWWSEVEEGVGVKL